MSKSLFLTLLLTLPLTAAAQTLDPSPSIMQISPRPGELLPPASDLDPATLQDLAPVTPPLAPTAPFSTQALGTAYLSGVGYEHQTFNNCGPAAVASVLNYYGQTINQHTYQQQLRPTGHYTDANHITSLLQTLGYLAPIKKGGTPDDIRREVAAGHPVLVLQYYRTAGQLPHWRVVRGYDADHLILSDSLAGPNLTLSDANFTHLWAGLGNLYIPVMPLAALN